MKRYRHYTQDRAIVLSCFGSVVEQKRYEDLKKKVEEKFPTCKVFLAFSSRMVLKHLNKKNEEFKNLPQVLADVDMLGYKNIVVSSINLFPTDEHEFMKKIVNGFNHFSLANINCSDAILTKTKHTNALLKSLHVKVSQEDVANLFIIHGTPRLDTPGIESINNTSKYLEYIAQNNFTCSLEGAFAYNDIKDILKRKIEQAGFKKVQIVPLLLVSGNHYRKDMFEIKEDLSDVFDASLAPSLGQSEHFNLLGLQETEDIIFSNIEEVFIKSGNKL
ncbi:sirohydrochlorin cobaltochelatase [Sulfurospirillum arcachonense]|uniref:sirohydrochlorin cobaltochelatase n=1 Tax=Sulfurospirillum arcachonense TaxID=57666 RepID=UPI000468A7E3|nr:sirohydrochlorin cobaltochelatase [Sulfurospirillum arcachonense]